MFSNLTNENIKVVDSFDFIGSRIDVVGGGKTKLEKKIILGGSGAGEVL
jgi:hypothetical protein